MSSFLSEIKNQLYYEIKKKDNLEYIKTYLLEPSMCHLLDKIYPYILIVASVIILLLILVIFIFIKIIVKK